MFLTGHLGLRAHAAFADDAAEAVVPDDLPLVRLFPGAGGGARRDDLPVAGGVFDHDRAAMVDDTSGQVDAFRKRAAFVEVFMHGIAAGADDAGNEDFIADLEVADGFFGEGRGQRDHERREIEGGVAGFR